MPFLHRPTSPALSLGPRRQVSNHQFTCKTPLIFWREFSSTDALSPRSLHFTKRPNYAWGLVMPGAWPLRLIPSDASLRCDNSVPSWEETASRAFSPVSRGELPSSTARSRPRAPWPTHTDVGEGAGPPSMATQAQVKHFEELAPSRPRVGSQEQPPSEAVRNAGRPRLSLRHSPLEQRAARPELGTGARAGASRRPLQEALAHRGPAAAPARHPSLVLSGLVPFTQGTN